MAAFLWCKRLQLIRPIFNNPPKYLHGYIVLVPEIGEDLPEKNPLLTENGLLEFNNITIEKCLAIIGKQAFALEKNVKKLEENLASDSQVKDLLRELLNPLEHFSSPLETTWGLAKTLYLGNSSLMPTKSYLNIHERARRARLAKFSSQVIYQTLKLHNKDGLTDEEKRLIAKYLLEGKLNGLGANSAEKLYLDEIISNLSQSRATYRGKVETAINQFKYIIEDYNAVKDFPPSLLQATTMNPTQPTKGPWKITLEPIILNKFLEYCHDKTARWNIWQADTRKASGQADKSLENSTILENIRSYRNQQAKVLGYGNFAEMSMETKMAGTIENVDNTFKTLLDHALPQQEQELSLLHQFAEQNGHKGPLEVQDVPYWRRKCLKLQYNFDEEIIREYFPLHHVLNGLFELSERLFNITIKERQGVQTWHEDVKYYEIFDNSNGTDPISGFYIDLYTREEAKILLPENPGWMVGIRNRSSITHTTALSALIFNFPPPIYGKPSLLSLADVQMLFNKFGYALQHLLTTANYSEVAGVSNIEWDAVKIPGHVLSEFLYNPEILQRISSHYVTEDPLSSVQLLAIQNQRKFFAGYDLSQELYLSKLDLDLHIKTDFWLDIVKDLYPKYKVLPLDKKDAHPCSWLPIFSGDWAAAYFSHLWSRFVAADAYNAFEGDSKNIEEVGKRFRDTYLSSGGGNSPAEVFRRFRGRDPSTKALISSLGLDNGTMDVTNKKGGK